MIATIFQRTKWFLLLLLLQVIIFNHIHLFGYATPMVYVLMLIMLPSDTPHWLYVLYGFIMGFLIDLFTNTPGIGAASATLTGFCTPWILRLFAPSGYAFEEPFSPTPKTMEWLPYLRFATSVVLINTLAYFLAESFTFFNFGYLLLSTFLSTLITIGFISLIELLRQNVFASAD